MYAYIFVYMYAIFTNVRIYTCIYIYMHMLRKHRSRTCALAPETYVHTYIHTHASI